uniref:ATPase AAA-type core domain-containing protein n=1 Tax=Davidia involucrata TaxID=16924 RepID=A0A5B7BD04_DAVIN
MMRRKGKSPREEGKEETWLFFLGVDFEGKEKTARELAKLVFGSQSNFVTIGLSSFSSTRADSTEEVSNKRARDELGSSYLERFAEAVQDNPSRVFFMEDIEQVDYCSQKGIKKAIESGRITLPSGDQTVPLKDAIVIFSCESFSSMSRACSPPIRQKCSDNKEKDDEDESEEKRTCVSLDLNLATEDDNGDEHSVSEIVESVDRQIIFRIQVL